eukprot:6368453-Prymnesium_polylepis.2
MTIVVFDVATSDIMTSVARRCPRLQEWALHDCHSTGLDDQLKLLANSCSALRVVSLERCPDVGRAGIAALCGCPSIQELNLKGIGCGHGQDLNSATMRCLRLTHDASMVNARSLPSITMPLLEELEMTAVSNLDLNQPATWGPVIEMRLLARAPMLRMLRWVGLPIHTRDILSRIFDLPFEEPDESEPDGVMRSIKDRHPSLQLIVE